MARTEQVRATDHAAPVITISLVSPVAAAGEAAIVAIAGIRGGADGLGVAGRRRRRAGWCEAQKVRQLKVALVQQASLVVGPVALSFGYEVEELCHTHRAAHTKTQKHMNRFPRLIVHIQYISKTWFCNAETCSISINLLDKSELYLVQAKTGVCYV